MQDIERLLGCIDFLLQTGHSVIVIDHDQALISQADWEIEMGPGPGKLWRTNRAVWTSATYRIIDRD